MARLLGHLGGQQPKTILSVIFGPFATNEETIFLKFQNKFFSLHPSQPNSLLILAKRNSELFQVFYIFKIAHSKISYQREQSEMLVAKIDSSVWRKTPTRCRG